MGIRLCYPSSKITPVDLPLVPSLKTPAPSPDPTSTRQPTNESGNTDTSSVQTFLRQRRMSVVEAMQKIRKTVSDSQILQFKFAHPISDSELFQEPLSLPGSLHFDSD